MALPAFEYQHRPDALADFRVRTTLWIALAGILFVTPFSLNNIMQGRYLLGFGSSVIVLILTVLAWLSYQGRYSDVSLVLFPPILGFLILSIQEQGIIGVMWTYPTVVCFYFMFREQWAWIANTITICVVVPLATQVLEPALALRVMVTLCLVSVFSILAVRVIGGQQKRLEQMAVTDSLTGLYNRSLLTPTLEQALSRNRRSDEAAALLAIDIDHFKNINDTFGHMTGDRVLVGVANLLTGRLRGTDVIFRTGGEEFSVVLPDTAAEPAHHVAQLLRSAVAGENLVDSQPITISIGIARVEKDDTTESLLARADRCLYDAKHGGRNRVVADTPLRPDTMTP